MHLNQVLKRATSPFAELKKLAKSIFPFVFLNHWKNKELKETTCKYKLLLNNSDFIVTLSHDDIRMFNKFIGTTYNKKVISIPNPNTYNTVNTSWEFKEKVILYVGRLSLEKGSLRLLKIWERLYNNYPDWQLVIVGEGDEKANMLKYTKEKQLRKKLT